MLNTYLDSLNVRSHFARGRIFAAKAILHSHNGELNEIEKLLPSIIDPSRAQKHYITLSYGLYLKVMLCYFRNKFEDCTETFESSFENRFRMRSSYFLRIWGIKALFHVKRNEIELLNKTLAEIDEFVFQIKDYKIEQLQRCLLTEIAIQKGEIENALDIARNANFQFSFATYLFYIPQFTLLKLFLRSDNPENRPKYLEIKKRLEDFAHETNHEISKINLNLLGALENSISGDENKAIEYLINALELTAPENNLMIYTEYGDEINELLQKLPEIIRKQKHERSIEQLFKEIKTKSLDKEIPPANLEIKLSGRDIKILKMVSRGHKNSEIAQSMFLSPESIKKYMYEIFQKLEVDNRIKAVIKANELGLID
jgi:ATP/maltotriose-dependent transcriptional regulator MalT